MSATEQVQRTPVSQEAGIPPRFHVMAEPTGVVCNLGCSYCFFLDKEALFPGSSFRMSDEVLERYVKQLIAAHRSDTVTFARRRGTRSIVIVEIRRSDPQSTGVTAALRRPWPNHTGPRPDQHPKGLTA